MTSTSTSCSEPASSRATSSGSTTSSPSSRRSWAGWRRSTPTGSVATGSTASASTRPGTSNRAFFRVWAPKILAAARAAGVPTSSSSARCSSADAVELSAVRARAGLPNVLDFPFQDAAARFAGRSRRARRRRVPARQTTTTSGRSPGVAHTPPTFLGNHDMGRAALMIQERSRPAASCSGACCSGTACSTSCAARRSSTTATRSGSSAAAATRRRARTCSRPRSRNGKTEERVGSARSATARRSTSRLTRSASTAGARRAPRRAPGALDGRDHRPARRRGACSPSAGSTRRRGASTSRRSTPASRRPASRSRRRRRRAHGPRCSARRGAAKRRGRRGLDRPAATGAVLFRADAEVPVGDPSRPALRTVRDDVAPPLWRLTATVAGRGPVSVSFAAKGRAAAGGARRRRLAALQGVPGSTAVSEEGTRGARRDRSRPRRPDRRGASLEPRPAPLAVEGVRLQLECTRRQATNGGVAAATA